MMEGIRHTATLIYDLELKTYSILTPDLSMQQQESRLRLWEFLIVLEKLGLITYDTFTDAVDNALQ